MFLRFAVIGTLALSLENLLVYVLVDAGVSYFLVRVLTLIVILIFSYTMNAIFTFKVKPVVSHFFKYTLGASVSILISYLISLLSYYWLFEGQYPLLSTNIGAAFAFIVNYLFQKKITFKK